MSRTAQGTAILIIFSAGTQDAFGLHFNNFALGSFVNLSIHFHFFDCLHNNIIKCIIDDVSYPVFNAHLSCVTSPMCYRRFVICGIIATANTADYKSAETRDKSAETFLIQCSTLTPLPVTLYQEIQRFGGQMIQHKLVRQGIEGIVETPPVKQLLPLLRIPRPGGFPVLVSAATDMTLPARNNIPGNVDPADIKRE